MLAQSRDTFYRYKSAVDEGGVEALLERTRRKLNMANRVDEVTEVAVIAPATDFPAYGQTRTSNELRKLGVFVSPSGVRSIWLRHDLANFKKRLKALEAKVANDNGIILTEARVQALEKKKLDDVACGEIETAHPGYLGSQDTFYVGTLKGVGRVYQQTYIDTYCKVAHAKLYTTKTPITAADLLNDQVLPFHEEHDLPVLRILTDRGTEFCGRPDKHDYQLFLAINDIDYTKTKVRHPQTTKTFGGICERFHKTILQEFYQITFSKNLYETIEQLQADLDQWLNRLCQRKSVEVVRAVSYLRWMTKCSPFRYFKTSPEIIRLAVMMYVRFPLSLRNVEDLLHERGIDISHETIRFWWNRFGPIFAAEIRKRRVQQFRDYSNWQWHLDEVFVRINGKTHYLWRTVDHEGEVLESYVTKGRDRRAALKFLRKSMKRYGQPHVIVTDKLRSYSAAMNVIGNSGKQLTGRWLNNRCENSHQPFRRQEKAMLRFRQMRSLLKFTAVHSSVHNHFNQERHFYSRINFKINRNAALNEWRGNPP